MKALPLEDHFEIREFNLELWDQESADPEALNGAKGVKHELIRMTGKLLFLFIQQRVVCSPRHLKFAFRPGEVTPLSS